MRSSATSTADAGSTTAAEAGGDDDSSAGTASAARATEEPSIGGATAVAEGPSSIMGLSKPFRFLMPFSARRFDEISPVPVVWDDRLVSAKGQACMLAWV